MRTLMIFAVALAATLGGKAAAQWPTPGFYGYNDDFLDGQSSDQYRLPNSNGTYGTPEQNVLEPYYYWEDCHDCNDARCRCDER